MNRNTKIALVASGILSVAAGYLMGRLFLCVAEAPGSNMLEQLLAGMGMYLPVLTAVPILLDFSKPFLLGFFTAFILVWLFFLYHFFTGKNFRRGEEHGSAKWGTAKDAKGFKDQENPDNNIILSKNELLRLQGYPKDFEYDRNKNVLVIGGSGSGKTRYVAKPNLLQLHSSYVITDPKGTLLPETGKVFADNGYVIRTLNTINFGKSHHYNPLAYIKSEKDILKLVSVIMENTKGEGDKSGEDFWVKAERLWYCAAIAYLYYEANLEDRNIPTMIDMLDMCKVKEDDENYVSPIDILFEELEKDKPYCFAVKQYKKFKQAAGKTMKSILISCGARLAPFDIAEVREITMYDELELNKIGDRKTAFYVIQSDTDSTFAFIGAMCFYQAFNLLCDHADDDCGGKLDIPVRFILDEFANCGKIPGFHHLISTIRSRDISAMIILQSISQINSVYKDDAETIIDCCDTLLFLGGKSTKTTKAISEMIGKSTIDNQNINESRGQTGSYSLNNQVLARDLIDPAEVGRLGRKECLVLISGSKPFRSKKYILKTHKRYRALSDANKHNVFDIVAYKDAQGKAEIEKEAEKPAKIPENLPAENLGEISPETENLQAVPELNELAG